MLAKRLLPQLTINKIRIKQCSGKLDETVNLRNELCARLGITYENLCDLERIRSREMYYMDLMVSYKAKINALEDAVNRIDELRGLGYEL